MSKPKVVLLTTTVRQRAEYTASLAPPDLDVIIVDATLPDQEKIPLCKDADALLVASLNVSLELIRSCPSVKIIQLVSAGYDHIDLKATGEMGIPVANNGGANAIAVAEHTLGLMLSLTKKINRQWHNTSIERRWRDGLNVLDFGEITHKTVGIVGLGRIGKQVAKRLTGFETRTLYNDIVEIPPETQRELKAAPVSLKELLRESDFVTLHVPLTSETRKMIGNDELETMKRTAYLINTSRGPVVDQGALYQALADKLIAGAGLDTVEPEPISSDDPLLDLDNVIITPHLGGLTIEAFARQAELGYANIKRALAGEPLESVVTPG